MPIAVPLFGLGVIFLFVICLVEFLGESHVSYQVMVIDALCFLASAVAHFVGMKVV